MFKNYTKLHVHLDTQMMLWAAPRKHDALVNCTLMKSLTWSFTLYLPPFPSPTAHVSHVTQRWQKCKLLCLHLKSEFILING